MEQGDIDPILYKVRAGLMQRMGFSEVLHYFAFGDVRIWMIVQQGLCHICSRREQLKDAEPRGQLKNAEPRKWLKDEEPREQRRDADPRKASDSDESDKRSFIHEGYCNGHGNLYYIIFMPLHLTMSPKTKTPAQLYEGFGGPFNSW